MSTFEREIMATRRAARALVEARKVLVVTGAGMSAESGVPTYRDEHGLWRDFTDFSSRGLQVKELAHLAAFRQDPEGAWGFYEYLRRIMARAVPHQGYGIITRWMESLFAESFLLTTNVDGLHLQAGVQRRRLWQRYGSIWELQCTQGCQPGLWWPEPANPICELDPVTLRAHDLPRCPCCGGVARPRIQLDHDPDFLQEAYGAQLYENFVAADDVDLYLIVGTTLWLSWPEDGRRRRVIHVNPDPETHGRYPDPLALTLGAEDALLGLDWMVRRLRYHGAPE